MSRRDRGDRRDRGGRAAECVPQLFLVAWAAVVVAPMGWVVLGSLKSNAELGASAWSWPARPRWENYARAWERAGIGDYFLNSVIVIGPSLALTILLGSMAAYVLARYEFPGNRVLYYVFLAGAMMPPYLALVPLFFVVRSLRLLNTYQGLGLVYVAYSLPFTVFFLHSFFRALPRSVGEAAMVDGASHTRVFFAVMLPMARPGLVSIGILNLIGQWNQYLLPVVLMRPQGPGDPQRLVLTQGLADLAVSQGYASDWPALFAGMTIAMVPVLAVYLAFQRYVHSGLATGVGSSL